MAMLTPEQRDFVRAAPQVSMELHENHKEIVRQMTDVTLLLQQYVHVQERDFAIAALVAIEEEIQRRKIVVPTLIAMPKVVPYGG